MRNLLQRLNSDERGVSAVEFGFLAPILATLILGIIDLSGALSERFTLQQAVNRSLEIVQANRIAINAQTGTPDYSFLRQEVATAAKVPAGNVTLAQWLECDGVRQGSYEGACTNNNADTARYLELRVTKDFRGKMFAKPVVLRATSAVRVQ